MFKQIEMNLYEIFAIVIIHFIADYVFQTEEDAKGKSSSWKHLLSHTLIYSSVWTFTAGCVAITFVLIYNTVLFTATAALKFAAITFICHTITDYFTSRLNKSLLPKEISFVFRFDTKQESQNFIQFPEGRNFHNFFVGIGFDQVLHYLQLFLTYYLLTK